MDGSNAFDENEFGDKSYKSYIQAYMTLLEGDASFVESQLKKTFYADEKTSAEGLSGLLGLGLLIAGMGNKEVGVLRKLRQYTRGKKIVEDMYRRGGRSRVNKLYDEDEEELLLSFG